MRAVLTLHSVDPSGSTLSMTAAQLDSLLSAVQRARHRVVPLDVLLADRELGDAVALTFDDGMATVASAAAPILARHGATATLFATTSHIGGANNWPGQAASAPYMQMLDWDQVRELQRHGWRIEAHTLTHPDLRGVSDHQLEQELSEPRDVIADHVGRRPTLFAYPYGYLDARVASAATRHYEFALTTTFAPLSRACHNRHRVPRLEARHFRHPSVHRHFGSRAFAAYLAAHGALRRARRHPGETGLI